MVLQCLNNILNAEKAGKRQVLIRPSSKVIIRFLTVCQKHGRLDSLLIGMSDSEFFDTIGYINEFEEIDDHRSGKVVVQLNGRINKCGVVSPRFDVQLGDIENWVNQVSLVVSSDLWSVADS